MQKRNTYLAFGTPDFIDAEIEAVARVMRSGWVGMGPETIAFEKELATYIGVPEVVTVNSCTSALFLALMLEGVGRGDEVIVPSLTWCATANAALYLGASPVFCDIDPHIMSVTPETILPHVTSKTKAVMVVHYGGYAVDVVALRRVLPAHIAIIEDAAHAFGSLYADGSKVGSTGNSVCFSFYANKNLSTAEGGAIALKDPEKAERFRSLRMSGLSSNAWSRYIAPTSALTGGITDLGYKMNYTDLQAAIGRVQLARFDEMAAHRLKLALHYRESLQDLSSKLSFQRDAFSPAHARHLLVTIIDLNVATISRNNLLLALREQNIGASVHYPPLHAMPLYEKYQPKSLPVTESLATRILTLPISARMSIDDVNYVTDALHQIL